MYAGHPFRSLNSAHVALQAVGTPKPNTGGPCLVCGLGENLREFQTSKFHARPSKLFKAALNTVLAMQLSTYGLRAAHVSRRSLG